MRFYLKDPKTSQPSVTLTMMLVGFLVLIFKLLTSGMVIHGIHFGIFTGSDFGVALGALGAIYGFRKHTDHEAHSDKASDEDN